MLKIKFFAKASTHLLKHKNLRFSVIFGRSFVMMEPVNKRACSNVKTIGTHSGTFHCDEVLACFMLRQLPEYENARIFRSRNYKELEEQCDIIVDVGGEFNHEKRKYDHHQVSFKETFSSLRPELGDEFKLRLSSAGLIYSFYGERVIESILKKFGDITITPQNLRISYIQIYRNFISEIDAIDNGIPICESGEPLYKISTHVSARIGKLNPSWEEEGDVDVEARFELAMSTIGKEFVENILQIGGSWIKARDIVRDAFENSKTVYQTGEILLLTKFCPWKSHLADIENEKNANGKTKLVIFCENPNSWRVAGVPIEPGSFLGRKFLPEPWRGLREDELAQTTGLEDLIFVHHTGFIGGAKTKEAALKMAIKSVEWPDKQISE